MATWFYITGTDTGFGNEAVRMLAEAKRNVFAGYFMDDSAEKLKSFGSTVFPIKLDVTSDESVAAAAKTIEEHLLKTNGVLGGVVNNAGLLFQNGPCEWTPIANWRKMHEVNVLGTVRVTNSVLPLLRKSEGRVVNVASIAGRAGLPTQAAYCASKHAVEGYSDAIRRELYVWGITVHIVEPGIFAQTGLYQTYFDGVEKLWQGTTDEIRTAYGSKYKDAEIADAGLLSSRGNKDASVVPKSYIHALTSKSPKYRYRCGIDSKVDITIFCLLPESVQDAFVRFKVAASIPAASSKAAANRGVKRYHGHTLLRKLFIVIVLFFVYKFAKKRLM